jgi:tRNA synthetases class I (C) catalytic domain
MGQLLYSYRTSTHRRPENEQVTKEFHHYRCKLFQLIWTSTGYQRTLHQEILQKYTARQLRLAFLTQLWNTKVDFSESSMSGEVRSIETTFNVSDKPWSVKKWLTRFTFVPEFLYHCEGSRRPSRSGSIPIRWSTSLLNPGS